MLLRKGFVVLVAALLVAAPLALADAHDEEKTDQDADAGVSEDARNASTEDDARATEDEDDGEDDDDAREDAEKAEDARDRDDEAREHGDDDRDKADEARRRVDVELTSERALFKLEKEDAVEGEEEIKLDYQAHEGVLKLEFEQESATGEGGFEYKLEAERVVEYVDENGNGVYDEDNDTLVASHQVDEDMTWTVLGAEEITVDNLTGRKVTAEGTFHDVDGRMRIVFYAFGDFADLNGTSLRPTEVKFDFVFEDYAYRNASSALALELEVEYEREYEGNASATGLAAMAGNVSGYFEWADWALVDGNRTPVLANVFEDESEDEADAEGGESKREQKLYLNYARGRSIVHDPILGVAYEAAPADTGGQTATPDGDTDTSGGTSDGTGETSSEDDATTPPAGVNETPFAGLAGVLAAVGVVAGARRHRRE